MKEYISRYFTRPDAEKEINKLAEEGWEILSIDDDGNDVNYVWMVREKPKTSPQLLQENLDK